MKRLLIVIVVSSFFLCACSKQKQEAQGPSPSSSSPVVATVGSVTITQEDITRELKGLPEQIQKMFEGPGGMERFVDEMVKKEMLYQEAKKKGLDNSAEYKKKVADFQKLTLISVLLEKEIEDKAKVSDKEVKDYYETHKSEFAANGQVRASHILVKTEDEANKIYDELKHGADFAKIAREKSLDTGSAKNGGDLGFFSRNQMVPEFEKVAFTLKKGEMSKPVKTQYGYHIIKVTDRKEGTALEFDKIKDLLTQKLTSQKQKELFDSYVNTLKTSYKTEINKELVSKMANTKPETTESTEKKEGTEKK
ncbi:MAG: peptidylprolyl isomerase [Thermodesulfovibrionales bacterium]